MLIGDHNSGDNDAAGVVVKRLISPRRCRPNLSAPKLGFVTDNPKFIVPSQYFPEGVAKL